MKKSKVINLFGDTKIIQNEGAKYSELLEKFIASFEQEFLNYEYLEEIIDFAILAWNFGNMKALIPNEEFKKIISFAPKKEIDIRVLKKMITYKITHFKEHTNFIIDFELEETTGDPILRVITQEETDYISNMVDDEEEQFTPDDYEENYINRSAIVIKPLQPFLDWYSHLNPEDDFEEDIKETNIYLVNEDIDDLEVWLRKKFDKFFMMELDEWCADKKDWPLKRNYKMFKQWFQVEISEMMPEIKKAYEDKQKT